MLCALKLAALAVLIQVKLGAAYLVDPPTTAPSDTIQDCTNWAVATSSDTCNTLADSGGITLSQLYSYNPSLAKSGCPVQVDLSYCIEQNFGVPPTPTTTAPPPPTSSAGNGVTTPTPTQDGMTTNCNKFHKVVSGDTCGAIASAAGISVSDFYSWNPSVKTDCSLLFLDYYVCTGIIGGSSPPTTTTPGNGISTPTPTQDGMTSNCNKFYKVKSGDTCGSIASSSGISLVNFYAWNPAVKSDCSLLFLDYYVCINVIGGTATTAPPTTTTPGNGITTPTPTQDGMTKNCNSFYKVKSGDTCAAIASSHGITVANFYAWNPAVKSDCSLLFLDYYVCVNVIGNTPTTTKPGNGVATPTPTQTNMTKNCKTFHLVVSGDTCQKIADNAHISLANFYSWNPDVKTDCSLLFLGYYVCIGLI